MFGDVLFLPSCPRSRRHGNRPTNCLPLPDYAAWPCHKLVVVTGCDSACMYTFLSPPPLDLRSDFHSRLPRHAAPAVLVRADCRLAGEAGCFNFTSSSLQAFFGFPFSIAEDMSRLQEHFITACLPVMSHRSVLWVRLAEHEAIQPISSLLQGSNHAFPQRKSISIRPCSQQFPRPY